MLLSRGLSGVLRLAGCELIAGHLQATATHKMHRVVIDVVTEHLQLTNIPSPGTLSQTVVLHHHRDKIIISD